MVHPGQCPDGSGTHSGNTGHDARIHSGRDTRPLQSTVHTQIYTLRQFSFANPCTAMFLGGAEKLGNLEETHTDTRRTENQTDSNTNSGSNPGTVRWNRYLLNHHAIGFHT